MRTISLKALHVGLALAFVVQAAVRSSAWAGTEPRTSGSDAGGDAAPTSAPPVKPPDWLARDALTGEWGGARGWLEERGVTIEPRLTQFYQGLAAGDGEHGYEYGGKADFLIIADLGRLGFWNGFSMTVHAEYNFGSNVNERGGVLIPVNTALNTPGMEGADAFDISSIYFRQDIGETVSLVFGKINMIDMVAGAPFMGGAGIDSFWGHTFTATPTGTVPPYLLGALLSVRTEGATYRLWIYDPASKVNTQGLTDAFATGLTIRGNIAFPVTIAGRRGHQGLTALYSTEDGADLESLDDILLPALDPGTIAMKDSGYFFAYSFDQYLYQAPRSPEEGVGLFGQVGVSDGNPNPLHWLFFVGLGGTGLVPGRSRDKWGFGYYYDGMSQDFKDALAPTQTLSDEQGLELFYNFALTGWMDLGADLQIIEPGLGSTTAVVPGLRAVIRF